jgi:hypothetical protein
MLVRISGELKTDVSYHIDRDLKPKEYKLQFGVDSLDNTFTMPKGHPMIPTILWGKHLELRKLIPPHWCENLKENYGDTTLQLTASDGERSVGLDVKLKGTKDEQLIVPPRCSTYHRFEVPFNVCPEIENFFKLKLQEQEFNAKWSKIRQDIRAFLDSAKSLNAALKAWPGLRAFIPNKYLHRVDTKVERKASTEAMEKQLAEIDRDMATAAATAAILAA